MNESSKLRVVLVDDEAIIVEGLRKVIKWDKYNCEVAGTAADARSGARLIREVRPDILITDICMPGQNGLMMLAGLRSEFPEMQVTVLTGYRDFSYAQEAIRLGVTRFLLKPSKMAEIDEAMTVMAEKAGRRELAPSEQNTGSFIVNQAVAYMEKHYTEKLSLQDVAEICYVSQWHLSKLLNKYAGQSFYDILNGIRVSAAKELLRDPSLRVGDIGMMVGYTDSAHFAKIFKKVTGVSANEYRNQL